MKADFDTLLQAAHPAGLRAALAAWPQALGLPQVQRLTAHARAIGRPAQPLRIGVIHTYTSHLLDPWFGLWAALHELDAELHHAPHGLALQEAAPGSALVAHKPDVTLLMLRREDLHPDLALPIVGLDAAAQMRLRDEALAQLRSLVELFREQKLGHLALSLLPATGAPALGGYDAQSTASEAAWWAAFKAEVGAWLRTSIAAASFVDLDDVMTSVGRDGFFDRRYWYSAQFPFTARAASEFARRVIGLGVVLKTPRAKVLVLDADNTLWGGVVGEDGFDGIALGPDYPGAAYRDFQRRILDFQQRGFILAMCSKNNEADVDQVLRDHPHQLLRDRHFAARRVNWRPKVENLRSLADELNLGLDSFVFVDDSDHECAAVREALPQVEVIQTPKRPVDVPTCLDQVARLEILALTAEDLAKTEMYAQERRRRELGASLGSGEGAVAQYLARLGMRMRIRLDGAAQVARLAQLTQKTNQFNLTTRRYDEQRMKAFIAADDWTVAHFSLADTFGDSGIVGLALWRRPSVARVELDTFLMSCRVIGREAEGAFLHALLRRLAAEGVETVEADFIPSVKNELAQGFLADQGFERGEDGRWRRDLRVAPPFAESRFPIAVELDDDLPAAAPIARQTDHSPSP